MPILRGDTSLGVHVRAVWVLLTELLDANQGTHKWARIKSIRTALERAYPAYLAVNEVELTHWLAEEDGDGLPEDI